MTRLIPLSRTSLLLTLLLASSVFAQKSLPIPPENTPVLQGPRTATHGTTARAREAARPAGALTVYSHGDPTAEEQYILELINRARSNPAAEGTRLANTTEPLIVAMYNYYHIVPADVEAAFATYPVRPPLAFNAKLIAAARRHSHDMADHNFQNHTGSDGSTFDVRINDAGYQGWTAAGENIFASSPSLWATHAMFNVDFGNATLGHRENIMNFKSNSIYREIGIGVVFENDPATQVGPIITTEDFGFIPKDKFLCGVVYNDANNNGLYDVGEGLPGVAITLSAGQYSAVTSTSGGYAVPIAGLTGSLTITASGGAFTTPVAASISLTGENMKQDFTISVPFPDPVALLTPAPFTVLTSDTARFSWLKPAGTGDDAEYEFVLATDSLMSNVVFSDTLQDLSVVVGKLTNGMTYYWKVRAKNSAGWGPWSLASSIKVAILPAKVVLTTPSNGSRFPADLIMLGWRSVAPGGVVYWVEVASNTSFTSIILRDTAYMDTTRALTGLPNGMPLYWRVKAKNIAGWGPFSDTWNFQSAILPGTVQLLAPADAATLSTSQASCRWTNPLPAATKFRFALAADAGMTRILHVDSTLTDTLFAASALQHDSTYYWQVTPGNIAGWGAPSAVFSFTVRILPAAIQLIGPADNSAPNAGDTKFTWQPGAPGVTAYQFRLHNVTTGTLALSDSTLAVTEQTVALDRSTSYWWHVRAKNSAGWGPWSPQWNLTTTATGIDALKENGFELRQNSPNPFASTTTFNFTLQRAAHVSLTVINSLGQRVATVLDATLAAGSYRQPWSAPAGLHGAFIYRLEAGTKVEVGKMVITQ